MSQSKLFTPINAGALALKNRVVMAPLTRNRATPDGDVPNDLMAEYYRQRASAGLIITEASQISPEGKGYAWTPGIYSAAQVAGWKKITDTVHAAGGKIVLQMWHVGRISHTSLQPGGASPVAPSAIQADSMTFDGTAFVKVSPPRALDISEMPRLVEDYRKAAENAKAAGFDGVEVHAANGYLLEQFLRETVNHREDAYGGSVENRARLLIEVMDAVTGVWGADRVGIRLSPFSPANGIDIGNPMPVYSYVMERLNTYGLAYVHVIEGATRAARDVSADFSLETLKALFDGVYMGNNLYDRALAMEAVDSGAVDLVAFGRPFISNPDLVLRLERNAPLNEPDQTTFYGGGAKGYTDYPALSEAPAA